MTLRFTDQVHGGDQLTRGLGGLRGVASMGGGLSLDFSVGANYERRTYSVYFPRSVNEGFSAGGDAVQAGSEFGSLLSENLVRYVRDFGSGHRIDAVGGFTYQTDKSTWNAQEVQGFCGFWGLVPFCSTWPPSRWTWELCTWNARQRPRFSACV